VDTKMDIDINAYSSDEESI